MAQTTTHRNACDVKIWIDNASDTATDCSGSTNSASMTFSANVGELQTLESQWPVRTECGKDCTVSLTVVYSTATDEGWDVLKNWYFATSPTARTVTLYLPDKNVGSDKISGEFRISELTVPVSAGDANPIAVSATLMSDGEITLVTNAT